MDLKITCSQTGSENGSIEANETIFDRPYNESLIHQIVTAYMAGSRSGTKAQKTRSDVSGGGAKPWRQKGTGRARAGTSRSPIWRKGGVTFAARPRNYEQKVNKKMYRAGMCSILSELVRQDRLIVVKEFTVDDPKTKSFVKRLADLNITDAIIITEELEANLFLASRNIPKVDTIDAVEVDPVSLIAYEKVIVTEGALRKIEEVLS